MLQTQMKFMFRKAWHVTMLGVVLVACVGTGCMHNGAADSDGVGRALDRIFTRPAFSRAQWSCAVLDLVDGTLVYARNPDAPLIPASNQKLFIAAAALSQCGPEYRNATLVLRHGPVRDGVLEGDLILRGFGAIHFTARYPDDVPAAGKCERLEGQVAEFAQRLREVGITRVNGRLVADATAWTDMVRNAHYPSAWALSFNENTLEVDVAAGAVQTCPDQLVGFALERSAVVETQDKARTEGKLTDRILLNPGVDSRDYWRVDAMHPDTYYVTHLQAALQDAGIPVAGAALVRAASPAVAEPQATARGSGRPEQADQPVPLFELPSLPLGDILADMGAHSDNFRAESVFLNLGFLAHGKANYPSAQDALTAALREAGMFTPGYVGADGSGLSRDNRASASAIIRVLERMYNNTQRDAFLRGFARPGHPGTLRTRLVSPELAGRALAKTGTLGDVKALSGYLQVEHERWLAFSFVYNGAFESEAAWRAFEDALTLLARP